MILLIPEAMTRSYRAPSRMEYQAECFSTLAHLLEPPDAAFVAHLAVATDPTLVTPRVAGHVALFAERLGDLSLEERQELFAETFAKVGLAEDRRCLVESLRNPGGSAPRAEVLASLTRLGDTLLRDRNPYHHLLVAARMLLGSW